MLIKMRDDVADLYRSWLRYFERASDPRPGYVQRTEAFFEAQRGQHPPLTV